MSSCPLCGAGTGRGKTCPQRGAQTGPWQELGYGGHAVKGKKKASGCTAWGHHFRLRLRGPRSSPARSSPRARPVEAAGGGFLLGRLPEARAPGTTLGIYNTNRRERQFREEGAGREGVPSHCRGRRPGGLGRAILGNWLPQGMSQIRNFHGFLPRQQLVCPPRLEARREGQEPTLS